MINSISLDSNTHYFNSPLGLASRSSCEFLQVFEVGSGRNVLANFDREHPEFQPEGRSGIDVVPHAMQRATEAFGNES